MNPFAYSKTDINLALQNIHNNIDKSLKHTRTGIQRQNTPKKHNNTQRYSLSTPQKQTLAQKRI
jgi:hypothetical protein